MIPTFPEFKSLEISDQEEVEALLRPYPLYSDFEYTSLWAWNVKEAIELSKLNGNLALKFTDYITGEPFYTFIGVRDADDTAEKLIVRAKEEGIDSVLHLVPDISVKAMNPIHFAIQESRDHFDYVCDIARYVTYSGGKLKHRRNFLNGFKLKYPEYTVEELDVKDAEIQAQMTDLYRHWKEAKGFFSQSESFAYNRFLEGVSHFKHLALGIRVEGKLVAFNISALSDTHCANGLFEKADTEYHGVYSILMHELARALLARGYTHLNYEQDLGVESLRKAKSTFDPDYFLKKYDVCLK